jgi:ATP-dependent Clp protease ATP-binding subunit ClpC
MHKQLNESAKCALTLAAEEARRLNHDFIGTEHILLGLLAEGSSASAGSLQRVGLSLEKLRGEIEKLVQRGPTAIAKSDLPLTPRAGRAIQFASELADNVGLPEIGPEHLLIGLLREEGGVAGMALRNLGVKLRELCEECLKIRKQQMRIVERAVRPVVAGTRTKRKMREEMLAHLSIIYDEEFASLKDPTAALEAAAKRFGNPAELAQELQASVPAGERRAYEVERWLGWRAPESVLHMMIRTSFISFCFILVVVAIPILAGILIQGWDQTQGPALRVALAMALLTPLAQFAVGMCYYKTRDWIWGVFGRRKSLRMGILWSLVAALAVFLAGMGFVVIIEGTFAAAGNALITMALVAMWWAIVVPILVRARGATEIRDTIWAMLDLEVTS